MTGPVAGALMLSLAVVVSPPSPRLRLAPALGGRGWAWPAGAKPVTGFAGVCAALAGVAVLPLTTMLAGAILVATAGLRQRRRQRRRRGIAEGRALETAFDVLVGDLRAGAHPARAFSVAAAETHGPVAASFRAVAARARLGADVSAGLRAAAAASALPGYWERLAVCWQLAGEHGLAMSTLMRAAQRDIAERQRFSAYLMSAMAGARATAAILAALPLLGIVLGQLIGARPAGFLLGGHTGGWLLVVGVTLACGGLLWSDRITDRLPA